MVDESRAVDILTKDIKRDVEAQMVMGQGLRTLNSRVRGSSPIAGSIYSFDRIFSALGLFHSGFDFSHKNLLTSLSPN